ncbi:MAG: hypothetical protein HGA94_03065 [Candidatus Aminicenantes bacterium]|nr:hypothetical protein [Candidatus Aminicenantes bacterium]
MKAARGLEFKMRFGINSGLVVTGEARGKKETQGAAGEAINLAEAFRLQYLGVVDKLRSFLPIEASFE